MLTNPTPEPVWSLDYRAEDGRITWIDVRIDPPIVLTSEATVEIMDWLTREISGIPEYRAGMEGMTVPEAVDYVMDIAEMAVPDGLSALLKICLVDDLLENVGEVLG